MRRRSMAVIREYDRKELEGKIRETRGELAKLRVVATKGTLKKDSGRLRPIRRDIARMETRLSEIRMEEYAQSLEAGGGGD
ncbi:MAG: 50S ribosomal protein L29 [Thaumarchaeota archaeon]|nr:50S ribosomal protein L29 [Nitrososphaerota archaeon]MDE0266916.1 50S ribosomal protein L29 [Nitrososphaerota archaeon]